MLPTDMYTQLLGGETLCSESRTYNPANFHQTGGKK
jgi:hypothetical protein